MDIFGQMVEGACAILAGCAGLVTEDKAIYVDLSSNPKRPSIALGEANLASRTVMGQSRKVWTGYVLDPNGRVKEIAPAEEPEEVADALGIVDCAFVKA